MAMAKSLTIQDFMRMFPDDDACLEHLFKLRYGASFKCPRCGEIGKFRKLSKMPAYTCQCGEHIHPMVGTPFSDRILRCKSGSMRCICSPRRATASRRRNCNGNLA